MPGIFQRDSIIADKTFERQLDSSPDGDWTFDDHSKYVTLFIPDTQKINIRQPLLPGQGSGGENVHTVPGYIQSCSFSLEVEECLHFTLTKKNIFPHSP